MFYLRKKKKENTIAQDYVLPDYTDVKRGFIRVCKLRFLMVFTFVNLQIKIYLKCNYVHVLNQQQKTSFSGNYCFV